MSKIVFGQKCILFKKDTNKILLLRRSSYKDDSGKWDMIGGSVQFGEDSKESIRREALEEAGVKIKKAGNCRFAFRD